MKVGPAKAEAPSEITPTLLASLTREASSKSVASNDARRIGDASDQVSGQEPEMAVHRAMRPSSVLPAPIELIPSSPPGIRTKSTDVVGSVHTVAP